MQMLLQKQHFLLSYFNTLSIGPAGVELTASCMALTGQPTAQPTESMACYVSVRKQLHLIFHFIFPLCLKL